MFNREELFIKTFIIKDRQERYLSLVTSKKGRNKFLQDLPHSISNELDPKYVKGVNGSSKDIYEKLKSKGAGKECYVISELSEIDGHVLSLSEALNQIIGRGMAAILICIDNKLAYFEGEEPNDRYILHRP
ncbi:MAG: hypothetical protein HF308_09945 [Ignavibacteria bacterium]|jgi:hypothetical protein|nr:hypothetical protein [Ignavibacteria bacterium]MCU7521581.1 hypothetical protein [Ignavibacteria bacterium]MCU7524785.1 hypothetical protein [Ignavibacteria bacterium]HEX2961619.1 hypothetical protein [Ignavibacteriales bacterium]